MAKVPLWGIVPTIGLGYFNWMVYIRIKSSNSMLQRQDSVRKKQVQEKKLSIVMSGIVVVFIVCHSIRNFENCYSFALVECLEKCNQNSSNQAEDSVTYISLPKWLGILLIISPLLLVINTSVF